MRTRDLISLTDHQKANYSACLISKARNKGVILLKKGEKKGGAEGSCLWLTSL